MMAGALAAACLAVLLAIGVATANESGDQHWNLLWKPKAANDSQAAIANSAQWGTCVPADTADPASTPPLRVCLVGLPASAVWSGAFSHQVYGHLRTTYSLLRSHGLGPALDACAVRLLINAPRAKRFCRKGQDMHAPRFWHTDLSWPSCNRYLQTKFETYLPWWRPLLRDRPFFYRADDRLHPRRDAGDWPGWCHHSHGGAEGAVVELPLPAIALAPSARWAPAAQAAAEANATAFVAAAVKRAAAAGRPPPTFVVRVPEATKATVDGRAALGDAVAQPLRNVFSRHNRYLHRAALRRFGARGRHAAGTLRLTLVTRRDPRTDKPLPISPSALCRPRGLRNADAVARALRSLCAEPVAVHASDGSAPTASPSPTLCAFRGPERLLADTDAQRQAQVRLATTTDVLVLYHGAALASTMWMPDDALVVVVFPKRYISSWYGVSETEDTQRNLTWVLATHRAGLTFRTYERGKGPDLARFMPGLVAGGRGAAWNKLGPVPQGGWPQYTFDPRLKDTCRSWDPVPVLRALRAAMRACHPSVSQTRRRNCLRSALVRWQAEHPSDGAWVLAHRDRPAHAFLEISDGRRTRGLARG